MAPHTLSPEQTPVITEYGGTTFRSQLEARWAARFDRRGIAWEYEPVQFDGWTPDFPMDVGQRILNSGCNGDILILGRGSRHAWRHGDNGWSPVDLTA